MDAAAPRAQWLTRIGGVHVDGREVPTDTIDDVLGPMEFLLEAVGIAKLQFNLLDALA